MFRARLIAVLLGLAILAYLTTWVGKGLYSLMQYPTTQIETVLDSKTRR